MYYSADNAPAELCTNHKLWLPVSCRIGYDSSSTQNTTGSQNNASQFVYLVRGSVTKSKMNSQAQTIQIQRICYMYKQTRDVGTVQLMLKNRAAGLCGPITFVTQD